MKFIYAALIAAFLAFPAQAAEQNVWRLVTTHTLDFAGDIVSTTDVFGAQIRRVQVVCTSACLFAFAVSNSEITEALVAAAEASTTHFLPANVIKEYVVSPSMVVVAIQVSSSGILYVTELTK